MTSKYLYLAAAIGFVAGAVFELRAPRNTTAAVLDAIAGALFFFLFAGGGPRRSKP